MKKINIFQDFQLKTVNCVVIGITRRCIRQLIYESGTRVLEYRRKLLFRIFKLKFQIANKKHLSAWIHDMEIGVFWHNGPKTPIFENRSETSGWNGKFWVMSHKSKRLKLRKNNILQFFNDFWYVSMIFSISIVIFFQWYGEDNNASERVLFWLILYKPGHNNGRWDEWNMQPHAETVLKNSVLDFLKFQCLRLKFSE